jgi:hypothetical protein
MNHERKPKSRMKQKSPTQHMSVREAMELVDEDQPDGAYWAQVFEMAGVDYDEGFAELGEDE